MNSYHRSRARRHPRGCPASSHIELPMIQCPLSHTCLLFKCLYNEGPFILIRYYKKKNHSCCLIFPELGNSNRDNSIKKVILGLPWWSNSAHAPLQSLVQPLWTPTGPRAARAGQKPEPLEPALPTRSTALTKSGLRSPSEGACKHQEDPGRPTTKINRKKESYKNERPFEFAVFTVMWRQSNMMLNQILIKF